MSWTDSQIESLITFYSSMLVSGARNFATGMKNWRQKPTPVFWCRFLALVSGACVIGISNNTTTTVLRPFVRDYPGEPVAEETLTHPPS